MKPIKAIDLCAGAGGWACAAKGLPIEIVAAVDMWDVACQTYRINWPQTAVIEGDVRDQRAQEEIGRIAAERGVNLILGGIPCEWLSVRRNVGNAPDHRELEDERRTLRAVLGLVERISPRWWCLEDVVGLAGELPAGTPWIQLDSADFSPQSRKRIYVGKFPRSFGRSVVSSNAFTPETVSGAYPARKSPTICCLSSRRDAELVIVDPDLPGGMRQLEWQEAARLQGFPENYLFYGSPTDIGGQIGQAVQIDMAHVILAGIVQEAQERRP